ncbi:MAG: HU family DNA-binding protein [Bacteroidaceae bacterium]|nr:HU family DNA-binding protein [Bacteroidaceae bacterium]
MSDKVTLQSVAESFSRACGVPKKVAEQLARAFFDTVVDGLSNDESVKIDGLGTFRVVEVASRESINVTNGERIVIAGYKKVNFIPEDGLLVSNLVSDMPDVREDVVADDEETDVSNDTDETDIEDTSEVDDEAEDVSEENTPSEDEEPIDAVEAEVNMVEVPEKVEVQEDEFSGIDMLICTPESVEEIRLELEQARADAERKLIAAKEAHREVLRLEALYQKMENGMVPESMEESSEPAEEQVVEAEAEAVIEPEAVDEPEQEVVPAMVAETVAKEDDSISVELPEVEVVAESPSVEASEPVEEEKEEVEEPTEEASVAESSESAETSEQVEEAKEEPATPTENTEASQVEALNRLLSEKPAVAPVKPKKKKDDGNYIIWILVPLFVVVLIGVSIVVFKYHSDKEKMELKQLPVEPKSVPAATPKLTPVTKPTVTNDSTKANTAEPAKAETSKANVETKEKATAKPKTYVLQKGESLTRVSQKFYNTKDSVRAIIRATKFKDPDNVPLGT